MTKTVVVVFVVVLVEVGVIVVVVVVLMFPSIAHASLSPAGWFTNRIVRLVAINLADYTHSTG